MKFSNIGQLALASLAVAAPVTEQSTAADVALVKSRAAALTDADILNFALTLEHLEKAFYKLGTTMFTDADFTNAGYSVRLFKNLGEVYYDESTHVSALEAALAAYPYPAVKKCTYDFGLTDVNSFMELAGILEGVGVTAYLGAASAISNPAYLTAAGSILTIESRHSAYIRDNNLPTQSPFPYPFDVPQSPTAVFSLASQFITSCPKGSNLPFTAFPLLTINSGQRSKPRAGQSIVLTVGNGAQAVAGMTYAYFAGNGGFVAAPLTIVENSGGKQVSVTIPKGIAGQSYLSLANEASATNVTDSNVIAGPAIVMVQSPYTYGGFSM